MINKTLKQKIRSGYYEYLPLTESKPGEQVKVSRELLIKIFEDAYDEINNDQNLKPLHSHGI